MAVIVSQKPVSHAECMAHDWHNPHRCRIYWSDYTEIIESVVRDNVVIEIGCGVFGGLVELILKLGCKYYIGIDRSVGNAGKKVEKVLRGEYVREEVPCSISIPEKFANDPRVLFFFGMDFLTFFRQIKSDRVVTMSTGFFHDALLMPQGNGKGYVEKAIREVARTTKKTAFSGFHHFMPDANVEPHSCRPGTFFRETFEENGLRVAPASKYANEQFFILSKQ